MTSSCDLIGQVMWYSVVLDCSL